MNKTRQALLCVITFLTMATLPLTAQIQRGEYWVDSDPGHGKATAFAVADQTNFSIPANTLAEGWHLLGMRVKNNRNWSQTYLYMFFASSNDHTAISKGEYWLDSDPGYGQATEFAATENTQLAIPTSDLEDGWHLVGFRVRNNANWSNTHIYMFYADSYGLNEISAAEYYIDSDPGLGKAYPIEFTPSSKTINFTLQQTDTLPVGYHLIGMRAKCGGMWSQTYKRQFMNVNAGIKMKVEKVEAWWDDDSENKQSVPFVIQDDVAIISNHIMDATALTYGLHTLHLQATADHQESIIKSYEVCKNAVPQFSFDKDEVCLGEEVVVLDESQDVQPETTYAWDMDGDGKVDITDKSDFLYTYKKAGRFTATLTVQTGDGCETTYSREIYVHSTSKPSVSLTRSASSICAGEAVVFKATPTNAGENPQYIWYLNGNILEDATADNLTLETLQNNDKVKVEVVTSNPCTEVHSAVSSVLTMRVYDLPQIEFALEQVYYTDDKAFSLSDKAAPTGGTFYLNGETVTLLNPARLDEGEYVLTYTVKNSNGCEASADFMFSLKDSEERGATLLEDVYGNSLVELHGRVLTLTEPTDLTVYTAVGQLVYTGTTTTLTLPQAGIYLLHIGDDTLKVAVTK